MPKKIKPKKYIMLEITDDDDFEEDYSNQPLIVPEVTLNPINPDINIGYWWNRINTEAKKNKPKKKK